MNKVESVRNFIKEKINEINKLEGVNYDVTKVDEVFINNIEGENYNKQECFMNGEPVTLDLEQKELITMDLLTRV
ncbi:hypothetical protein AALK46_12635 [Staphylococcus nepalensis]|uniref:hypothetical protein n=1 Tax=Staphylococcus TaxID=1279 RepID=UPI002DB9B667|nr:hypothetical protein [Staphylococcus pseudoxylosus]MEB6038186.1 hypothetical protein [Staphylococcus pseudoxylosus]